MKNAKNKTRIFTIALILLLSAIVIYPITVGASPSALPTAGIHNEAFRYPTGVTNNPYNLPRGTFEGNSITSSPGPVTNHILWKTEDLSYLWGQLVSDGRLYVAENQQGMGGRKNPVPHAVAALDAYTGEVIWRITDMVPVGEFCFASPPLLELAPEGEKMWTSMGYLYGVHDNAVTCFNPANGAILWQLSRETMRDYLTDTTYEAEGIIVDAYNEDYVYAHSGQNNGVVWAITKGGGAHHLGGGQIAWATVMNTSMYTQPIALVDGKLYFGDYSGYYHCLDASNGEELWTSENLNGTIVFGSSVVDGMIYFDIWSDPCKFVALDADTGDVVWTFNTPGPIGVNPVIYQGRFYHGAGANESPYGYFYCLDAKDGSLIWEKPCPTGTRGVTVADGKLYYVSYGLEISGMIGTEDVMPGGVHCVDPITGDTLWEYIVPELTIFYSNNLPIADGIAYIGTESGILYAFGMGPTTTELFVTDANLAIGETLAINGEVYDESPASPGAPVANVPVKLEVQKVGENNWVDIDTVTTDDTGLFVSEWTPTTEGTYTIFAHFDGTDSYGWSSKTTVVQVNPAPPPSEPTSASMTDTYLAGSTVAIIAAIAIAVFLILRKK